MSPLATYAIWLLVVPAGFLLLVMPLVTWFTYRLEHRATVELLELDSTIGEEVDEYVTSATEELQSFGFEPIALLSVPQMMSNVRLWLKWFVHHANEDQAVIQVFLSK